MTNIDTNIKRVQDMETYLDFLLSLDDVTKIYSDDELIYKTKELINYLESGLWLEDFQLDEMHLFPETLKRGVLSQDTLYNFLENIDITKL